MLHISNFFTRIIKYRWQKSLIGHWWWCDPACDQDHSSSSWCLLLLSNLMTSYFSMISLRRLVSLPPVILPPLTLSWAFFYWSKNQDFICNLVLFLDRYNVAFNIIFTFVFCYFSHFPSKITIFVNIRAMTNVIIDYQVS